MSLKCYLDDTKRRDEYVSFRKDLEIVFDKQDVDRGLRYFLACPDETYEKQRPFQLAIESCYCAAFHRKNR